MLTLRPKYIKAVYFKNARLQCKHVPGSLHPCKNVNCYFTFHKKRNSWFMVKCNDVIYNIGITFIVTVVWRDRKDTMMLGLCDGQLKLYSSVTETAVDWLWYPYIPFGKITLIQGDPGCGKSTLMMSIISAVSNGSIAPDGRKLKKPMHVIYQCSEDGLSDTIKPRLNAAGADCANVAFLDEEINWVTLNDDSVRRAIADFNAKLLVIDPIQAYLGEADIASASGMRKVLRQLSLWAAMYDCAVVLIGHLNKKQNSKELYRSLGSIDLVATARSVIQVEHLQDDAISVVHHVKSSLAPKGRDLFFSIDSSRKLEWLDIDPEKYPSDDTTYYVQEKMTKQARAADILSVMLADGPVAVSEIHTLFNKENISERTILNTKKLMGIKSIKRDGAWYWLIPKSSAE